MNRKAFVAIVIIVILAASAFAFIYLNGQDQPNRMHVTDKTFQSAEGRLYAVYTGTVGMSLALGEIPYYYSDGYFVQDPQTYNSSMATMSFLMAANGFVYAKDYETQSDSIREFLDQIGCTDFHVNQSFREEPTENSIGVAMATLHRTVDGRELTIIPVVLRSGGYGAEWVSNFYVGQGVGESEGFREAAEQVCQELKKYMSDHRIDGYDEDVRFWMTGYSRGAAVVNIAAKNIIDCFDTMGERTYAYTFATPNAATAAEVVDSNDYTGIHNIYDRRDLVPVIPPTEFGLFHYGVDHFIPGADAGEITSQQTAISGALDTNTVIQIHDNYDGLEVDITKYDGYERASEILFGLFGLVDSDCFHTALLTLDGDLISDKTESQSLFVREMARNLGSWVGMDRQVYADGDASLQRCIQQFIRSDESLLLTVYSLVSLIEKAAPIIDNNRNNPQMAIDYILNMHDMPSVIKKAGITESQYEFLIDYIVRFLYQDMENNSWQGSKLAGTIMVNGMDLVRYHFPTYMPCWLMASDPMYDDFHPVYHTGV